MIFARRGRAMPSVAWRGNATHTAPFRRRGSVARHGAARRCRAGQGGALTLPPIRRRQKRAMPGLVWCGGARRVIANNILP
jgi:hypothetical protein